MLAKLESLEQQFIDLEKQLSDPEIVTDQERYRKLTKAHSDLKEVVDVFRKYKAALKSVEENAELAEDPDPEMRALAEEEIRTAKSGRRDLPPEITTSYRERWVRDQGQWWFKP